MKTYDAALLDLKRVLRDRANELLRCRWEDGKVVGTLVHGTADFCARHECPAGGNPGITFCTDAFLVLPGEENARWLAAWTWRREHESGFDVDRHLRAHEWERVEDGVYGGTLKK